MFWNTAAPEPALFECGTGRNDPFYVHPNSPRCVATPFKRRPARSAPEYPGGIQGDQEDRTYKLGSGITSEYGHYVKSPGEP